MGIVVRLNSKKLSKCLYCIHMSLLLSAWLLIISFTTRLCFPWFYFVIFSLIVSSYHVTVQNNTTMHTHIWVCVEKLFSFNTKKTPLCKLLLLHAALNFFIIFIYATILPCFPFVNDAKNMIKCTQV